MSAFNDLVAEFKTQEVNRVLFVISKDKEMQSVVSAWSTDLITMLDDFDTPPPDENDSEVEKWKWLWAQVAIDEDSLVERAGAINSKAKLLNAINFKLIYPDGTINQLVEGFINVQILKAMKVDKKKRPFGKKPPEKS